MIQFIKEEIETLRIDEAPIPPTQYMSVPEDADSFWGTFDHVQTETRHSPSDSVDAEISL